MILQTQEPQIERPVVEQVVTLRGVSWEQFKAIAANLEEVRGVRLTYLDGVLEIVSPIGELHEYVKSTLGVLVEAYLRHYKIRHYRLGGFTLEAPGYSSGEPDESYCIGTKKEIPDIVIEVIVTSGTINRRELFRPLKVPEVWFWRKKQLRVFCLMGDQYEERDRSQLLPDLDLSLLLKYVDHPDQYDAVQEFLAQISR
jgi:Uma2 family endonuclease